MARTAYECGCCIVPCCGREAVEHGDRFCDAEEYPNEVLMILGDCQNATELAEKYPDWNISYTSDGWVIWREKVMVEFYGNHYLGFDRIPHDTPGSGMIHGDAWRTDCDYALSPYWSGVVVCEVPYGCDFKQDPLKVVPGFRVVRVDIIRDLLPGGKKGEVEP